MNSAPEIAVVEKHIQEINDQLGATPPDERANLLRQIEVLQVLAATLERLQSTIH